MRQILDIERQHHQQLGDSQSLYFTPAGTPLREALAAAAAAFAAGNHRDGRHYCKVWRFFTVTFMGISSLKIIFFFKYGEARGKIFNIGCRIFFLSFKDLTRCIFAVEKIKTVPCSNYRMYCISVLVQLHCQCCESECQCPVNICFKCVSGKSERAEQ